MKYGIAVVGSHGVGRSAYAWKLCKEYREKYKNVGMVTGIVEQCPYPTGLETTREAQLWIYHATVAEELRVMSRHECVIADRTGFDNLAYAEAAGFQDIVDTHLAGALYTLRKYSRIVWVREKPNEDEGVYIPPDSPLIIMRPRGFKRRIEKILEGWLFAPEIGLQVTVVEGSSEDKMPILD